MDSGWISNYLFLQETLHKHNENNEGKCSSDDALEACECVSDLKESNEETEGRGSTSKQSLFRNWPYMSSIIVYCVFSLHDIAYTEVKCPVLTGASWQFSLNFLLIIVTLLPQIFSLWAVSDRLYGGLSFTSNDVGEVLAISGTNII